MSEKSADGEAKQGVSKVKLAMGAASLFLFIVGIKRTFQVEDDPARGTQSGPQRPRT